MQPETLSNSLRNWGLVDEEELSKKINNPHTPLSIEVVSTALFRGKFDSLGKYHKKLSELDGKQLLYPFIEKGETEIVRGILQSNLKKNVSQEALNEGLHLAARQGLPQMVSLLLEHVPEQTFKLNGKTVLHVAIESGSYSVVAKLAKNKMCRNEAIVHANNTLSPVQYAVRLGKTDSFDALIDVNLGSSSKNLKWVKANFTSQTAKKKSLLDLAETSKKMRDHLTSVYRVEMGPLLKKDDLSKSEKAVETLEGLIGEEKSLRDVDHRGLSYLLIPFRDFPANDSEKRALSDEFKKLQSKVSSFFGFLKDSEKATNYFRIGCIDYLLGKDFNTVVKSWKEAAQYYDKSDMKKEKLKTQTFIQFLQSESNSYEEAKASLLMNDLNQFFLNEDPGLVVTHLITKSQAYRYLKKGNEASQTITEAISICEENKDVSKLHHAVSFLICGELNLEKNPKKSLKSLNKTLELVQKDVKNLKGLLPRLSLLLIRAFLQSKQTDEAIRCCHAAYYLHQSVGKKIAIMRYLSDALLQKGIALRQKGSLQEAYRFLRRAKALKLQYSEDQSQSTFKELGSLSFEMGYYDEAFEHSSGLRTLSGNAKKALETKISGESDFEATLTQALALSASGKHTQATKLLGQHESGLEELPPLKQAAFELASGHVYRQKGNTQKGEKHIHRATELFKQSLGTKNPRYASALIEKHASTPAKTLVLHQKALTILRKAAPRNAAEESKGLLSLAQLHLRLKNYNEALNRYRQALTHYYELFGKNCSHVADCFFGLAKTLVLIGENKKAHVFFQAAKKVWEKMFPDNSYCPHKKEYDKWEKKNALPHLGDGKVEKLELEDFLLLIPALPLKKSQTQKSSPNNLPAQLAKLNQTLVTVLTKPYNQQGPQRRELFIEIGNLYFAMGNYEKAYKSYARAAVHTEEDLLEWKGPQSLLGATRYTLDPEDLDREGIALAFLGKHQKALLRINLALKLVDRKRNTSLFEKIQHHKGVAYLLAGDEQKALNEIKKLHMTSAVARTKALSLAGLGRCEQAHKLIQDILQAYSSMAPLERAECLLISGKIEDPLLKNRQGIQHIKESMKLFEEWCGVKSPKYAVALSTFGNTNHEDDASKNIPLQYEAIRTLKEALAGAPDDSNPLLLDEANARFALADLTNSMEQYRAAMIGYYTCYGLVNGHVALCLFRMAKGYDQKNDVEKTRFFASAAITICEQCYDNNHPRRKHMEQWIQDNHIAIQKNSLEDLDLSQYLTNPTSIVERSQFLKFLARYQDGLRQTALEASFPPLALISKSPDLGSAIVGTTTEMILGYIYYSLLGKTYPWTWVPATILGTKALSKPRVMYLMGHNPLADRINRFVSPFWKSVKSSTTRMVYEAQDEIRGKLKGKANRLVHSLDKKLDNLTNSQGPLVKYSASPVVDRVSQAIHKQIDPSIESLLSYLRSQSKNVGIREILELLGPVNFYWTVFAIASAVASQISKARFVECREQLVTFGVTLARQLNASQIEKIVKMIDELKDMPKVNRQSWYTQKSNSEKFDEFFEGEEKEKIIKQLRKLTKTDLEIVSKKFKEYRFTSLNLKEIRKKATGISIKTGVTWLTGSTYLGVVAVILALCYSKICGFSKRSIEAKQFKAKVIKSRACGLFGRIKNVFRRCCGYRRR